MRDRLTYWKCPKCFGTGRVIRGFGDAKRVYDCSDCDGTGNGLVDGATERHKRELEEFDAAESKRGKRRA